VRHTSYQDIGVVILFCWPRACLCAGLGVVPFTWAAGQAAAAAGFTMIIKTVIWNPKCSKKLVTKVDFWSPKTGLVTKKASLVINLITKNGFLVTKSDLVTKEHFGHHFGDQKLGRVFFCSAKQTFGHQFGDQKS